MIYLCYLYMEDLSIATFDYWRVDGGSDGNPRGLQHEKDSEYDT